MADLSDIGDVLRRRLLPLGGVRILGGKIGQPGRPRQVGQQEFRGRAGGKGALRPFSNEPRSDW